MSLISGLLNILKICCSLKFVGAFTSIVKFPSTLTFPVIVSVVEGNKSAIEEMLIQLSKDLENDENATCFMKLESSASNPQTEPYNELLSQRRMVSAIKYIESIGQLKKFIDNKRLTFSQITKGESAKNVAPIGLDGKSQGVFDCSGQDSLSRTSQVYSVNAMACCCPVLEFTSEVSHIIFVIIFYYSYSFI